MNFEIIQLGQWRVNPQNNTLTLNSEEKKLENKPMQLLMYLISRAGEPVSKDDLIANVWQGRAVSDDVLSVAVSQIRKALSDSARNPTYIKTISGLGYCLIAEVKTEQPEEKKIASESDNKETDSSEVLPVSASVKKQKLTGLGLALMLLLLASIVIISFYSFKGEKLSPASIIDPSQKVLAILPIASYSEQKSHQHLSDSLTEILISEFAKRADWRVISHTSVERFKNSDKKLPEIAKELGADLVMEGRLIFSGADSQTDSSVDSQVAISLQLIDGQSDTHYWAERFNYLKQPSYAEQETIVALSIDSIAKKFPKAIKARNNGLTRVSTDTNVLYEQARHLMNSSNKSDWQQALALVEQAVTIASDYAPLYVLMAQVKFKILDAKYGEIDQSIPEYRALLSKALELDPQLSITHRELGNLYFMADWQFDMADHHFKKAISLNANDPETRFNFLTFLLAMKRLDEAKQQIKIIRQLDPLAYSKPMMAWVLNMQRKYEQALQETDKLLSYSPDKFSYHWSAQSISENLDDKEQSALHMLRLLEEVDYSEQEQIQIQLAAEKDGLSGIYYWLLHVKKETRHIGQYLPPISLARYAIPTGNNKLALDYLEQALEAKQAEILWIGVDPKYDALREEPKFRAILLKLGL